MTIVAGTEHRLDGTDATLLDGFIDEYRLRNLTPRTITEYLSCLRIVSRFLNQMGLCFTELDKHVLRTLLRYLTRDRKLSFKTLGNYFSALSTFYDYLVYEEMIDQNPIPPFRKRYVRQYKTEANNNSHRKLISVEEMAMLINSILDHRNKAIVILLAKTGIRRNELIKIDLDDIDWLEQSLQLKPHPKRSNCTVFFDDECSRVLQRWIKRSRMNYNIQPRCQALFISEQGGRLQRHGVLHAVTKCAEQVGLHDSTSKRVEDHFTPHCCRHWFTTHLRRNGMRREFLMELRGDARREAMDIYDRIDRKELRQAYLAAIPVLGID